MQIEARRGKFRARIRIQGQPPLSRTFHSEAAARAWGTQIEDAARSGRLDEVLAADRTFAQAVQDYADHVTPTKRGEAQELVRVQQLLASPLAPLKLSAVSRAVLRAHRDRRLREITGGSWNRELSLVSQILRRAVAEHDAKIDPAGLLAGLRGREAPGRDRVLSDAEEAALLAVAPAVDPLLAPVITILIESGLRRSELLAARREHLQGGRLLVPVSKNGKARTIVLTPRALAAVAELPARLDGRLVDWTGDQITSYFRRAVRLAGIDHVRLHDCRHTAVSRWVLRHGLTVAQARQMSGHLTLSAFTRYLNRDDDALGQIERRLAA